MGDLTIGDVMDASLSGRKSLEDNDNGENKSPRSGKQKSQYGETMSFVGVDQLAQWGVFTQKGAIPAYRFPACADRVLYWAADSLFDRMTWEHPRGGYEVNHAQLGSDHRPVAVEAVLKVAQSGS